MSDRTDQQEGSNAKPVVFFHVMKCGGTSVRRGLAIGVAGTRHGPDVFELDGVRANEAVGGPHLANKQFRDTMLLYVLSAVQPSLVLGHFRYNDRHAAYLDDAHCVTVLRDPVDRFVSLYKWRRYKEGADVRFAGSLEDFLSTPRWRAEGHRFVGTFCGRDDLDPRSDEAVDAAVSNLRRFAAVGWMDRLDDFAADVSRLSGKSVSIERLNPSPAPQGGEGTSLDPELMAQIHEACAPDRRLHEQLTGISSEAD